jgi:hypothetical protein
VLIVSNTGDTCPASPPTDAPKIAEALTHFPRKDILYLESATIKGRHAKRSRLTAILVLSTVPSNARRNGTNQCLSPDLYPAVGFGRGAGYPHPCPRRERGETGRSPGTNSAGFSKPSSRVR